MLLAAAIDAAAAAAAAAAPRLRRKEIVDSAAHPLPGGGTITRIFLYLPINLLRWCSSFSCFSFLLLLVLFLYLT